MNSRSSAPSTSAQPSGMLMALQYSRSRKNTPTRELLVELVYRPLAWVVVRALLPLRVPPPAVVLAGLAAGIAAAVELARGDYSAPRCSS